MRESVWYYSGVAFASLSHSILLYLRSVRETLCYYTIRADRVRLHDASTMLQCPGNAGHTASAWFVSSIPRATRNPKHITHTTAIFSAEYERDANAMRCGKHGKLQYKVRYFHQKLLFENNHRANDEMGVKVSVGM